MTRPLTIKQRDKGKGGGSLRSRSAATKPSAALSTEQFDRAFGAGYELGHLHGRRDAAEASLVAKGILVPEQEGHAEALREGAQHRSQSILSIFHSFIAKWWKR